jgi:ornithine carbamoyltransferase
VNHLRTALDLEDRRRIDALMRRAQALKRSRRERRLAPTLAGRVVALLFERESTRTRMSFEAGVKLLGGSTLVLHERDTQLVQGEPIRDVARVLGGYVDLLMARTREHATVEEYARHTGVPVVNGLSDRDHPCQVLTDLFTVFERREDPFGLAWAFVGEATPHMRGLITVAGIVGMSLRVSTPTVDADVDQAIARARELGGRVERCLDPRDAVNGADVVVTGPVAPNETWNPAFCLDANLLGAAHDEHFVLHALPARRGREISDDVLEGTHSLAFEAAKNRVPVQQAILEWLLDVPSEAR